MSCPFKASKSAQVVLTNKRAVVVGGTSGIGEGIAMRLAKAQASVTIVGRNARGHEIVQKLGQLGGTGHEFLQCDASSMKNISTFCSELKQKYPVIDFLVQTQGMASVAGRTETPEGIDQKLALHYFSRMCFIQGLLPALRQAEGGGKILSVLSAGVHAPYADYREEFELKNNFSLKNCADAAGFYNDLGLDALSREKGNEGLLFVHAAPGFVNTNWGTEMPWYLKVAIRAVQPLAKSIEECGEIMAGPLLNPPKPGGLFLMDANGNEAPATKLHDEARQFVWEKTLEVLARAQEK